MNGILDKKVMDYESAERRGEIPMLLLSPTIINDERKLFISAQPVSFLCVPPLKKDRTAPPDGIDMMSFFAAQDAAGLPLITALRMNSTYPFILPNVFMPSDPPIEVMDAGIRDNFGVENICRFITHFSDWINEHTSGVIIVQMHCHFKMEQITDFRRMTAFEKLFTPIGNIYNNWSDIQRYNQEYFKSYTGDMINGKLEVVKFEYFAQAQKDLPSLSFHLTEKEKREILRSLYMPHNLKAFEKLQQVLVN
jgi:hypothetical protein